MARFLKQSFAQTCLKETDNGKLQQLFQITDNEPGNGRERKNSQCMCHEAKYTNMEGSFKAWRPWERNDANEVVYNRFMFLNLVIMR